MSYEVAAPNTVLAGPTSGPAAPPAMRAIVATDVPLLNQSTTGTAGGLSTTLAIISGGTGATTAPAALSALGALPAAGGTMTGPLTLNADATNPLQAVTFEQLQAVVSGNEYKAAVYASATANITGTFSSAGLGIGDTLTGTLVAFSTDGQSPSVGARILLPFQTTQTQNGIYTLTTVGSGSTAWVLTRATDYDQVAEIQPGDLVPVEYGTLYGGSIFLQTATVVTMDTSNIVFAVFNQPSLYALKAAINIFTATQTFNGTSATEALKVLNAAETAYIVAAAPAATTNLYVNSGAVQYYTTAAANNWILNIAFSSGTALNTAMAVGDSITVAMLTTQGATAYYASAFQVDGVAVTPKWQGIAPTAGDASSIDAYSFTILKTASATYTVLASLTKYA